MVGNDSCPDLNPPKANKKIVTADDVHHLVLSTEDTSIGTRVRLSCHTSYKLTPSKPNIIMCRNNLKWDYVTKPKCEKVPTKKVPAVVETMTQEEKIIVGVTAGVGAIILVVLILLIVYVKCSGSKIKKRQDGESLSSGVRTSNKPNTELDYDSWRKRYQSYERPRLGLTPVTVPVPNQPQNPYTISGNVPYPAGASKQLLEPPQDYDDVPQDRSHYGPSRSTNAMFYNNRGYEPEHLFRTSAFDRVATRPDPRDNNVVTTHRSHDNRRGDAGYDRRYFAAASTSRSGPHNDGQSFVTPSTSRSGPPNDGRYIAAAVHNRPAPVTRWGSLENFDKSAREHSNSNRISRTFDANDPYLWRPVAPYGDRGYHSDHRM